jgi:molybdopterin synthase catalytic subunit
VRVTVLYFATLRNLAGARQEAVDLEAGARLSDLQRILSGLHPGLAPSLPTALSSVNREFAFPDHSLSDGDEVAFFPPVSGGAEAFPTVLRITEDSLDLNEVIAQVTLPSTGAVCVFTGIVRARTARSRARTTARLEYDAYRPMAEEKLRQVAEEIRQRWPAVEGVAIVQRLGPLDPGTPTVLIACSASHRDTGVFEAARYGIDRLKQIVPIWKKEVGPDGEAWVEGTYHPGPDDRHA